ncbi:serine/threonine-protein kinase 19 isoform X2 [Bufo bufo]|nr:serine/threonine-protein kinase 19 isoform X2 [Bufo bufo]XP_040261212.1 serine/threonine-protein kinase 19 isoform X2 [Bufo bufo]XP_040261213.1 serine/threonine-protein kinase 19 isoform X2 [Bufo bufo]XP_040261214.1 serine/threonine-protein kinase 19 isoform X2 [Bufo bufo]
MDRKRKLTCDPFKVKKPREENLRSDASAYPSPYPDFTENLQEAVSYLWALFPRKLFNDSLPPMFLRHQLYSLSRDRTAVDRLLSTLQQTGEVCLVQPGFDPDSFLVVRNEDFVEAVIKSIDGSSGAPVVRRFLDSSFFTPSKISYNREEMMERHRFSDAEISQLVHAGLLTVRDAGSWWLSIPGVGKLSKHFIKGQKALLSQISRSRYKEVLLTDLSTRKPPPAVRLGMEYHIHDIIGAGLVDCVPTPSGTLLRLSDT